MSDSTYRIERKFLIHDLTVQQIAHYIKLHPSRFTEIYHVRKVNNIYFDTITFDNYSENINGENSRVKVRIRWYGNTFGTVSTPALEFKIKKGIAGKKVTFHFKSFNPAGPFSKALFFDLLQKDNIPGTFQYYLKMINPVILNSYTRKYFISSDKKFRLTLDTGLVFYPYRYGANHLIAKLSDDRTKVVELKYKPENDDEAREVTSAFPFPVTKSSKFIKGVEYTYF